MLILRKSTLLVAIIVISLLITYLPSIAMASWSTNPTENTPICTEVNDQHFPRLVSDGSGGTIIAWIDLRIIGHGFGIYAQRVDNSGNILWTDNGTLVCTAASDAFQLIPDNSGGAIIVWEDYRGGDTRDIYVQRIDSSGVALWSPDGVAICTADDEQENPQLVPDGSGGAIIVWDDNRNLSHYGIYAQRVDASGNILWTDNGTAICTAPMAPYDLSRPQLVSDGSGGAVIAWQDSRYNDEYDVFAQRIDASGNGLWTDNGTAVCVADTPQNHIRIVSDGSEGAIITWEDFRNGVDMEDVYAQRVDASGNNLWTDNGKVISNASSRQRYPEIVSDGSGGAIITWQDGRTGPPHIYAQRVNPSGSALWTDNGTTICDAADIQLEPQLVADSYGGAIITWQDVRDGGDYDIYAQRVDASGSILWMNNGIAVCNAALYQYFPQLLSDDSGGAIFSWEDVRDGNNYDIYAQRVNSDGSFISLQDISVDPTEIAFGQLSVGSSSLSQTVTVNNEGSNNLNVGSITIEGPDASEFLKQNDNASGQSIVPGASATLEVVFSPNSAGIKAASLSIPSDDPDETTVSVDLSGSGYHSIDIPICTKPGEQRNPHLVPDGSGGVIITWQDDRSLAEWRTAIYAQRLNSSGVPLWKDNGEAICVQTMDQQVPYIISDSLGGAIITWTGQRTGEIEKDIFAQRVDANGNTMWTDNGTAICTADGNQGGGGSVPDSSGGAIIVWADGRSGEGNDLYAQRVDSSGIALWTDNGTSVCNAIGQQLFHEIVSDGSGGAIIAWLDDRNGSYSNIYAQRLDGSGNSLWTNNGIAVCTANNTNGDIQLVSDGSGGAIIVWVDSRNYNSSLKDIYAQRVDAAGNTLWTDNGTPLCTIEGHQLNPQLVADGSGGAIVTWEDLRLIANTDIYAQRVNASGQALWTDNGTAVCTADELQLNPQLTSDTSGGIIITWEDRRRTPNIQLFDIYAQRMDTAGNTLWEDDGIAVCTANNTQEKVQLVSDGADGAVFVWQDDRIPFNEFDIYAQFVSGSGSIGIPPRPRVNFSANVTSGMAPLSVGFDSTVTDGTPPYTYAWDFDNDAVTDDMTESPLHVYNDAGVYTVSLKVTDDYAATDTKIKVDYITVSGVTTSDPDVTIDTSNVSEDPVLEDVYSDSAPPDVDWSTARGFEVAATTTGADGTYTFRITFMTPITPGLVLYKLPDWTVTPYTPVDAYSIDVQLEMVGGVVDPPFLLTGDVAPPIMEIINEAQGQYFTSAPVFSNFGFDDGLALDDGWYQIDSFSGAWTSLFTDVAGTSWDNDGWTLPGFSALADGSYIVYFMASDDTGNEEGESGEWSWQFHKGDAPGGGGGGGGGGARGVTDITSAINPEGCMARNVTAISSDLQAYIELPVGTFCLNSAGTPIYWIYFKALDEDEDVPAAPEGAVVITPYYEIEPEGTTFSPQVACTFEYDLWGLPDGADPDNLSVMYRDTSAQQWLPLTTTVDAAGEKVTAMLDHLSLYTVMLLPSPAHFEMSDLSITPAEVEAGGEVTVSVSIANTGELSGDYDVVLSVNGVPLETRNVTIAGGDRLDVTFTVSRDSAGTYTIDVNGVTGELTFLAPPEPEPTQEPGPETVSTPEPQPTQAPEVTQPVESPMEEESVPKVTPTEEETADMGVKVGWWLYIVIIAAVVVLGLAAWLVIRKRKSASVET